MRAEAAGDPGPSVDAPWLQLVLARDREGNRPVRQQRERAAVRRVHREPGLAVNNNALDVRRIIAAEPPVTRPALEVADIFRDHGAAWRRAHAGHVSLGQLRV